MSATKHVLVLGGGIVGLCSAYYLRKQGYLVSVVDAGDGSQNCSVGNAGFLCPSHVIPLAAPGMITQGLKWMLNDKSPFYVKPSLNRELLSWGLQFKKAATKARVQNAAPLLHWLTTTSQQLAEQMIGSEKLEVGYSHTGLLMACKTESALHHEIEAAKVAQRFGQRAEVLNAAQAAALNPEVEMDLCGAVYFPDDTLLTPHLWMRTLKELLRRNGVRFYDYTLASGVAVRAGRIAAVCTELGEIEADEFVMAMGSATGDFLKALKLHLPMQGGKGYSFMLPAEKAMPRVPVIFVDGKVSMSPMADGLRFSGTMEINGSDPAINRRRIEGIVDTVLRFLPQYMPEDFEDLRPWVGFRPCSPDGLPYLGRPARYPNLIVATGHAMLGVTLGAVSGDLVTKMVSGEPIESDISLLHPDRYQS